MRLWHYKLISLLPRQQLLGQHRECCALRGNGWGRKHATVDYVFLHSPCLLVQYHFLILQEMQRRGYHYDALWEKPEYRGRHCTVKWQVSCPANMSLPMLYPEHDDSYLQECLDNLRSKGIELDCSAHSFVL